MKKRIVSFYCACLLLTSVSVLTRAQVVIDGTTNVLSNTTNTITGLLTVGTNGSFTLLVLSNNCLLTNSGAATIGLNGSAKSNEVRLVSPTARWLAGNYLAVGDNGSASRLVVSGGALMSNRFDAYVGVGAASSNNVALITGANSLWNVANTVNLGPAGGGNQLIVSNAAKVVSGFEGRIGGLGSLAWVTGAGSQWNMVRDLYVGLGGSNNRLRIEDGGLVSNDQGNVGANFTDESNEVLVSGAGALWTNRLNLSVGQNGALNRLIISNGGWVINGSGNVGAPGSTGGHSNLVVVTGAGSVWSNRANLNVGQNSRANQLVVSAGGLVSVASNAVVGASLLASSNTATVSGPGSSLRVAGNFLVGSVGAVNRLVISNGATLQDNTGRLGFNPSSSNNLAFITGAGSIWSNAGQLFIGETSRGNTLIVSNGAVVKDTAGFVGLDVIGSNLAAVTGAGSLWTNSGDVFVGNFGANNRLLVSDGGAVHNNYGFVGIDASASNTLALVSDAGSVWSNALDLYVGYSASRNQLVVSNGAAVFSQNNGFIGFNTNAAANVAVVTGPGSRWMGGALSQIYVGSNGPFNQLIITNGGLVAVNTGYLGDESLARSNLVVVTGAGSLWSNRSGVLEMGQRGSGNRLVISNGGSVYAPFFRIGRINSGVGNEVLVTGSGSSVQVPDNSIRVGETGSGNRVVVDAGAEVFSRFCDIGSDTGSNNQVVVTGPGSLWTSAETLVGLYGNRNRLIVSNSATFVSSTLMRIGQQSIATNNQVLVDGGVLLVTNAAGNALLEVRRGTNVLNAGRMDVDFLYLTNSTGKFEFNGGNLVTRSATIDNNSAFVVGNAGPGSAVWEVRPGPADHFLTGDIFVGGAGSFAQMIHTNGAFLTNGGYAAIGSQSSSLSNLAVLSGPASRWWLGDGVLIGDSGSANRLLVREGASLVTASISYLGLEAGSSNNEAMVSGVGTTWTCNPTYGFRVGYEGHDNQLRIVDGAFVSSGPSYLGEFPTSSNNLALVSGAGSVWRNTDSLFVGGAGVGNQLVVSNGATVFGYEGIIGYSISGSSNAALVTGAGSTWSNAVDLFVGNDGRSCQLVVSNGGTVRGLYGTIGLNPSSSNNLAVVTSAGSMWSNTFDLFVGQEGRGNQLLVDNGALLVNSNGFVGYSASSLGNLVSIAGPGTLWSNRNSLHVGQAGAANQVLVSNGARLEANNANIGFNASSTSNLVAITGPGSFFRAQTTLTIGTQGAGNQLVVSDGAGLHNDNALMGYFGMNNDAVITGPGTTWTNRSGLYVGRFRGGNRLTISNAALVVARDVWIGADVSATNNRVVVAGGTLLVTAVPGFGAFGALNVERGTNVFNAGLIDLMRLSVPTPLGQFEFNGGRLVSSETVHSNGRPFTVGNGVSAGTFELRGGLHTFANNLTIANNSALTGNGIITGALTVQPGGRISPGTSIGKIFLSNAPSLQGLTQLELSKTSSALTNDQIQITAPLTYSGTLVVSNVGAAALAAGDRFALFNASSYAGSFSSITLPPLPATLLWTNKLAVDGSIEVVPYVPPLVGLTIQVGNGVLRVSWPTNGADYCLETSYNLAPPIMWQTVSSGITNNGTAFVFAMASVAAAPQQFFRLAFPCSEAPLTLSLQLSNNLVTVSWPSNQFRLETTYALQAPVVWQTLSNGITDSGGLRRLTITNNPTVTNQFFRLAFP